jgi:hypothetical protein
MWGPEFCKLHSLFISVKKCNYLIKSNPPKGSPVHAIVTRRIPVSCKLGISAHKKWANEDQVDVYLFFTNGVEEVVS